VSNILNDQHACDITKQADTLDVTETNKISTSNLLGCTEEKYQPFSTPLLKHQQLKNYALAY